MLLNLNRRRAGLMLMLLGGIVALICFLGRPRVESVVLFSDNTALFPRQSLLGEHWIPASWAWYWRTKEFIFGSPRTVTIGISFIHVEGTNRADELLPAAVKIHTNLHFYFVSTNEIAKARNALTGSTSRSAEWGARITTAKGIQSKLTMGSAPAESLSVEVLAKRRGPHTDLRASVQASGLKVPDSTAMRDLKSAARLQIPTGHAALILKLYPNDPALVGVILTPQWK